MTNPPAGWYPDYDDSSMLRWWNGWAWTGLAKPPIPSPGNPNQAPPEVLVLRERSIGGSLAAAAVTTLLFLMLAGFFLQDALRDEGAMTEPLTWGRGVGKIPIEYTNEYGWVGTTLMILIIVYAWLMWFSPWNIVADHTGIRESAVFRRTRVVPWEAIAQAYTVPSPRKGLNDRRPDPDVVCLNLSEQHASTVPGGRLPVSPARVMLPGQNVVLRGKYPGPASELAATLEHMRMRYSRIN